jgi:hypothetical protein
LALAAFAFLDAFECLNITQVRFPSWSLLFLTLHLLGSPSPNSTVVCIV